MAKQQSARKLYNLVLTYVICAFRRLCIQHAIHELYKLQVPNKIKDDILRAVSPHLLRRMKLRQDLPYSSEILYPDEMKMIP